MFPELETMIADITQKLERQETLGIWFDPDGRQYCTAVLGGDDANAVYRNSDMAKCLTGIWNKYYGKA